MASWAEDIDTALGKLGGSGTLDSIYAEIAKIRPNMPKTWKAIVRRRIQDQSSDSEGYKGIHDRYYSVGGLGGGVWATR